MTKDQQIKTLKRELKWALKQMRNLGVTDEQEKRHAKATEIAHTEYRSMTK